MPDKSILLRSAPDKSTPDKSAPLVTVYPLIILLSMRSVFGSEPPPVSPLPLLPLKVIELAPFDVVRTRFPSASVPSIRSASVSVPLKSSLSSASLKSVITSWPKTSAKTNVSDLSPPVRVSSPKPPSSVSSPAPPTSKLSLSSPVIATSKEAELRSTFSIFIKVSFKTC